MATHQSLWGSLVYLLAHYGWQYVSSYGVALRIGVLSFLGGLALAFVLTMLRVSPIPPLRAAISFYVEVFRNIPVLALLIFIVFALPEVGLVIDYEPSVIVTSIIMPQALRTVVQPMVTLFISVIVSSSIGAMVPLAHTELTGLVNQINTKDALGIPTFFVAALFYVCTGLVIAGFGGFLEKKVALCR